MGIFTIFIISTPDFAKPWFINYGGTLPIVIIWYFFVVPSQFNNRLGFMNPGLTLYRFFPVSIGPSSPISPWHSCRKENGSQWQDYVENCCPPDFRPFPGDPVVDAVIEELLQLQLAQQETQGFTKTVIDPTGLKTNRSYEVYNCEGHTIARGEHTIFSGFFKSWFGFPLLRPLWTCLKTGCFQIWWLRKTLDHGW
jgi:hypothetical protein